MVDAYDDPNAENDVNTYRAKFHIAPCTSAGGCFKKIGQSGTSALPSASSSWAEEISLDIDMVSAICPNCHILLVEASSTRLSDVGTSVNTAARLGANAISNSYGGAEGLSDANYDTRYFNHPGIAVTVS